MKDFVNPGPGLNWFCLMKIHAQHNQWEAKRRTGCNCCTWLLTGNGARDRQSENHSPPVTLAWRTFHLRHQRTDVSSSRLTRGSSRLEPREKCVIREFFCQASHTSDSVLSGSALACTWSPEPKPLLLKVNCLKYGRLFPLRKKKYTLIVSLTILGLCLTILTYFLTILRKKVWTEKVNFFLILWWK